MYCIQQPMKCFSVLNCMLFQNMLNILQKLLVESYLEEWICSTIRKNIPWRESLVLKVLCDFFSISLSTCNAAVVFKGLGLRVEQRVPKRVKSHFNKRAKKHDAKFNIALNRVLTKSSSSIQELRSESRSKECRRE